MTIVDTFTVFGAFATFVVLISFDISASFSSIYTNHPKGSASVRTEQDFTASDKLSQCLPPYPALAGIDARFVNLLVTNSFSYAIIIAYAYA